MTNELTPGKRLFDSYEKVLEAEQRMAMAQQTLQGAQRDLFDKQSRFSGQLEFVAGGPCKWKVNVETKEIEWELLPEAPKSDEKIVELPRASVDSAPTEPEPDAAASAGEAAAVPSPS